MQHRSLALTATTALVVATTAASASAETVRLDRNQVIPVVLQDELSSEESRRGDRFFAVVENGYDLPRGTRFSGRVIDAQRRRGDRPAYLEAEFNELVLPDGKRTRIRAIPISLNDQNVRRDRDGRIRTTDTVVRKEKVVGTGALAGLVIGALTKTPFEGLVWGTIAGILVAEGQASEAQNGNIRLRGGSRIGVMIEDSVTVDLGNNRYDRNDRYDDWNRNDDWNRDDRYNRDEDDWNRDDRYDDRRGDDRYDDWQRDEHYNDLARIQIRYRNDDLRFTRGEEPYRIGETIMVPLERTARQMDLDVEIVRGSNVIWVEDEDSVLKIEQGTRTYRLNGSRGTLPRDVARRDGQIFVPLEVLAKMKSSPVYANGKVYRQ
jgi:hypothetical protein